MSSSIIEQIRYNYELSDLYEKIIGDVLDESVQGQKAKVSQQHRIAFLVNKIRDAHVELKRLYADEDGALLEEAATMTGPQMFGSFYDALNTTRDYHLRFPNVGIARIPPVPTELPVQFSGEEVFGKYLDLHEFYVKYCNLPSSVGTAADQDYLQYLDRFNSFFHIPEASKGSKQYKQYVEELWQYLSSFFQRVQPLVEFQKLVQEWRPVFEQLWAEGKAPGWKGKPAASQRKGEPQPLRLGMFNSSSELEVLGMDRLKEALEALGLKCGGSLKDRAERLWAVRGKKPEEIPEKLKAKSSAVVAGSKRKLDDIPASTASAGAEDLGANDSRQKQLAWEEFKIVNICDIMMAIVTATRRHAEKQQARTREEKEQEIMEEEFGTSSALAHVGDDDDEGDDDGPIYNPLNLPLGWDGKPIPYWLYKLHGLSVEHKCEICGNQSYWGRRNFDRHFQEWRHAHGMRCLGVPNTKHFHDITLIEDVLALYAKIKTQLSTEQFTASVDEEFEDTEGNVLNRRTYEDLARQGLL